MAMTGPAVNQLEHLDEELETILTSFDTSYAWRYGNVKEGLRDLYEKAKRDQWNGTTQLKWDTDVDPERGILPAHLNPLNGYEPYERLSDKEKDHLRHGQIALQLSQFLHGEQGALIVASQLVGAVPWIDAKYYAGTQTMDEARHVEVFSRYLTDKLEWQWPVNESLKELLDATITDARWDFKYLGMQIIIEGLAMAAFGNLFQITQGAAAEGAGALRHEGRVAPRRVRCALAVRLLRRHGPGRAARPRGLHHLRLRADAEPARRRPDRRGDGLGSERGEGEGPHLTPGDDVPAMLFARVVPNLKRLGLLSPRVRGRSSASASSSSRMPTRKRRTASSAWSDAVATSAPDAAAADSGRSSVPTRHHAGCASVPGATSARPSVEGEPEGPDRRQGELEPLVPDCSASRAATSCWKAAAASAVSSAVPLRFRAWRAASCPDDRGAVRIGRAPGPLAQGNRPAQRRESSAARHAAPDRDPIRAGQVGGDRRRRVLG
jgi:hypothetical protein